MLTKIEMREQINHKYDIIYHSNIAKAHLLSEILFNYFVVK